MFEHDVRFDLESSLVFGEGVNVGIEWKIWKVSLFLCYEVSVQLRFYTTQLYAFLCYDVSVQPRIFTIATCFL